jgi:hypothetical protein
MTLIQKPRCILPHILNITWYKDNLVCLSKNVLKKSFKEIQNISCPELFFSGSLTGFEVIKQKCYLCQFIIWELLD